MKQTAEDQAINRRVAKALGTWDFLDCTLPAAVMERHSTARARTVARTKITPTISCIGWEEPVR